MAPNVNRTINTEECSMPCRKSTEPKAFADYTEYIAIFLQLHIPVISDEMYGADTNASSSVTLRICRVLFQECSALVMVLYNL